MEKENIIEPRAVAIGEVLAAMENDGMTRRALGNLVQHVQAGDTPGHMVAELAGMLVDFARDWADGQAPAPEAGENVVQMFS